MTTAELADGRVIELDEVTVETVRVRILPGGRVDRKNAAKYLGREPKTLADWKLRGIGPRCVTIGGRCFYFIVDLDTYLVGEAA